MHLLHQL